MQASPELSQVRPSSWHDGAEPAMYTSTAHPCVSYRPQTASPRPQTAHPVTAGTPHSRSKARPATAHTKSIKSNTTSALTVNSASLLSAAAAASAQSNVQLSVTHVSQIQQRLGRRSISPMSDSSTGFTPSPAQTPISVLSRPSTAGEYMLSL